MTILREEPHIGAPLSISCGLLSVILLSSAFWAGCTGQQAPAYRQSVALSGGALSAPAELFPPKVPGNPGVLIFAEFGTPSDAYIPLAEAIHGEGYGVVAFSHPRREIAAGNIPDEAQFGLLDAAMETLAAAGVNRGRIALAGSGVSATAGAFYAVERPLVEGLILISPGLSTQGLLLEEACARLWDRPLLLMAGDNDAFSASAAQELKGQSEGFCELRLFPGAVRGFDLFIAHENGVQQLLQWLEICLPVGQDQG